MAAWRPKTDEAIAMFITDQKALWKLARKGKSISIEFPVKAGGTRTAVFETGGRSARVVRDPALGVRHGRHADGSRA
ncbi:hypothetical protein G6F50_018365 [Rhizopus delemar]|uniref:Uncharacterized protein n=1 Tax=Rhizopus delemar TaxID=936053 RepID=A0A9P6XMG0_9FUNG|nr:hypothetical protein G6F50_018365 [Rhizopus delemar]